MRTKRIYEEPSRADGYRWWTEAHPIELDGLRAHARRRTVTLLYAAQDPEHNHARILKAVLESD